MQRFFQVIRIDPATLARLLVRIVRLRPPWHLAIDRTDWRFGNTPINLLVLAIVTRRVRLPILFIVLEKAGSSSADECIRLMQTYLDIFPPDSVRALLADREFGMCQLRAGTRIHPAQETPIPERHRGSDWA